MRAVKGIYSTGRSVLSLGYFREALIAFSFNVGGIIAGFMVAYQFDVFQLSKWALAIYPEILTVRGLISGLLSGRLGTALHVGTVHPRLFGNTKNFYLLFKSVIVLTLLASFVISLVSVFFGSFFWGITLGDFPDILVVVSSTMFLGLALTLVTAQVSFISFKKGLDPDVITYPVMSTVADIAITLCYVFTLNLFFLSGSLGRFATILLGILLLFLSLAVLPNSVREPDFIKTIRESFLTLLFVAFIVNVTGTILRGIEETVGSRLEIYTVYPAIIDTVGDVGSVVGSTATTRLFLGFIEPSLSSIRNHAKRIFSTWLASIIMFLSYVLLSLVIHGILTLPEFLILSILLLLTNILAVPVIILISYAIAILTFKKGWDPDNFVIPIQSSLADSITTLALFISLLLIELI
ncbi:MAG: magnesium transporter [Candidatus Jordarchaeum sp.]|uniref:magnesium transporter n=1 Tax=Candidatus Jordarchaeum sp. TaxID=2823881 RepID=UPI00404932AA